MTAARKYEQLALECLNLVEATRDPVARERLLRLAEFCGRLTAEADRQGSRGFWVESDRAA
jgi:hypothetical protein